MVVRRHIRIVVVVGGAELSPHISLGVLISHVTSEFGQMPRSHGAGTQGRRGARNYIIDVQEVAEVKVRVVPRERGVVVGVSLASSIKLMKLISKFSEVALKDAASAVVLRGRWHDDFVSFG